MRLPAMRSSNAGGSRYRLSGRLRVCSRSKTSCTAKPPRCAGDCSTSATASHRIEMRFSQTRGFSEMRCGEPQSRSIGVRFELPTAFSRSGDELAERARAAISALEQDAGTDDARTYWAGEAEANRAVKTALSAHRRGPGTVTDPSRVRPDHGQQSCAAWLSATSDPEGRGVRQSRRERLVNHLLGHAARPRVLQAIHGRRSDVCFKRNQQRK